jgi:hypothetical protein
MEYVVLTGDTVIFDTTTNEGAVVTLAPSVVVGTGKFTVNGVLAMIDGDEATIVSAGTYIKGGFLGGTCKVSISGLSSSQLSSKVKSNNKAVVLATGKFNTSITVVTPALQPAAPSPIPDPVPTYTGTGTFVTTNTKVKA